MVNFEMKASDISNLVGNLGLAVTIVVILIFALCYFTPKFFEQWKKQKEKDQEQMDRLLNMQAEQTKSVTSQLERSNIALERNNIVIEANTRTIEFNANTATKTQETITKCTDTISELSNEIEKNTDINQKVYTEVLILKDNVQNIKEKVS